MSPHQLTQPIPYLDSVRERRKGARAFPLDISSIENTEHPRDIATGDIAGENYYYRTDNPPYWHRAPGSIPKLYVREGLMWRLEKANKQLRSIGLELFVFDAYRPIEVQNYFHDIWVPGYLRKKYPDWSEEQVLTEVGNYWAKGAPNGEGINPLSPPPHSTGGAIDCTVRNRHNGEHLFMGTVFDEVDVRAHTDYYEVEKDRRVLTVSEEVAMHNRRQLYWVMHDVGMANNPNEWWHYSYGDQLWAKTTGAPTAVYSAMVVNS